MGNFCRPLSVATLFNGTLHTLDDPSYVLFFSFSLSKCVHLNWADIETSSVCIDRWTGIHTVSWTNKVESVQTVFKLIDGRRDGCTVLSEFEWMWTKSCHPLDYLTCWVHYFSLPLHSLLTSLSQYGNVHLRLCTWLHDAADLAAMISSFGCEISSSSKLSLD